MKKGSREVGSVKEGIEKVVLARRSREGRSREGEGQNGSREGWEKRV